VVCAVADARTVDLAPLSTARPALTWWTSAPQAGDVALLLADSTWRPLDVDSVATRTTSCAGSPLVRAAERATPRLRLRLAAALPDGVAPGTPVRFVRRVRWVHYRAADARWYLGEREWTGGAWTVTQPVAGPLRPPGPRAGVAIVALDSAGSPVPNTLLASRRVAWLDVVLRADVPAASGRPGVVAVDSIAFRAAPRNGR
jgi:hypothetical protein